MTTQLVKRVKGYVYVTNAERMQDALYDRKATDFIDKYYCSYIALFEKVVRAEI